MSFGQPLFLLTLLLLPIMLGLFLWAQRRRARYAVKFTNMEVLSGVVGSTRSWRRYIAPALFLLALAALCLGLARPKVNTLVPSQQATVIIVIDVSGSMHASDIKPTRLAAAQKAVRTFLDHAPKQLRVGLIAFAGDPNVAAPPTTDHGLVRAADDSLGDLVGFGGTAIGDALQAAVQLAHQAVGPTQSSNGNQTIAYHPHGAQSPVSILFLSDGHQTRGTLQPLQGAALAKAAGIPVYTVALGTPNGVLNITPDYGGTGGTGGFGYPGSIPVPPDPVTLKEIADMTGGKFTNAQNAKTLNDAYASLGSRLGRKPGKSEVTNEFVLIAAGLLLGAGLLSVFWSPRLP